MHSAFAFLHSLDAASLGNAQDVHPDEVSKSNKNHSVFGIDLLKVDVHHRNPKAKAFLKQIFFGHYNANVQFSCIME